MYFIELKKHLLDLTCHVQGSKGWNIICNYNKHELKWCSEHTGHFKIDDTINIAMTMDSIPQIVDILKN